MKWNHRKPNGVIGVCQLDGGNWSVCAARQHGSNCEVVATHTAPTLDRAIDHLTDTYRHWPRVAVLPDVCGLHHAFELPEVEPVALQNMVQLRIEALLPQVHGQLQWGWQRSKPQGPVWIYAATQDVIQTHLDPFPEDHTPSSLISQSMAIAALVTHAAPTQPLLIIHNAKKTTCIIRWEAGQIKACAQIDPVEHTQEQLGVIDELLGETAFQPPPKQLLIIGPPAHWLDELIQRRGLTVKEPKDLFGEENTGVLFAQGAAFAALSYTVPQINLNSRADPFTKQPRRYARLWILAAIWLIVSGVLLLTVDLRNASKLQAEQTGPFIRKQDQAALTQAIALARYLEERPASPLTILDEIAQITENAQIDEVSYEQNGELRFRGQLGTGDAVNALVAQLAKAKTMTEVRLIRQKRINDQKVSFDIVATPSSRFIGSFVKPVTPKQSKTLSGPKVETLPGAGSGSRP